MTTSAPPSLHRTSKDERAKTLESPPPWLRSAKTAERTWLTPAQAVRYLGLPSIRALYQCVRRGQLPAHRLGRSLRFLRGELDAVLKRER